MNSQTWLVRAGQSIASAELLLATDPNGTCSNAYYAMFYAARAALLHVGQAERAMGKSHSGMVSAFSQFIVLPGLVEPGYGRSFSFELNRRISATYEADGVEPSQAVEAIANAQAFVTAVRALVGPA